MKKLVKAFRLSTLACACAIASNAAAQKQSVNASDITEVVVTASRTDEKADSLVSEVVVIRRAQIEAAAGLTLGQLLAREAGIQSASNGGLGKSISTFIRGTETRHTILLIDGVRFGSATLGTPTFENIPLEMIERIEVLKGPASALYGSDGVGGVIQIFTKTGKQGLFPTGSITLGSNSFSRLSAGLSGGADNLTYALGLQSLRDNGFSATNSKIPFGNFNPDRDGFKQESLNGSLRWKMSSSWAVDAKVFQANGVNQFDDGPNVDTRAKIGSTVIATGLEGRLLDNWKTRLSYASSKDAFTQTSSASAFITIPSIFNTKQTVISWKNDISTPIGVAIVGLENLRQDVTSTTKYTVSDRTVNSAFLGLNGAAGAHRWQANLRNDKNSQFGDSNTSFVGYGYALTQQWRVNASYGTSFVAPSFNQLYFPNFGNVNLQPERGRNTDVGITYVNAGQTFKLIHFSNQIRGFISNTTIASNIPQASIEGWTFGYEGKVGDVRLRASYDSLDPRNELTGKLLPRRSRHQMNLGADYDGGTWRAGTQLVGVGSRFDNGANTTPLAGYTTLDVYADYKVAKDWTMQARVNNLTNRQFETAFGFNQPGRSLFLTARYSPK